MRSSLTLVIPTKNRPDELLRALRSVAEQTYQPNAIIIVDQSERPLSYDRLMLALNNVCLAVDYIYDPTILGLVDAKRYALDRVETELISFIEDDVILCEDYVERVVQFFDNYPKALAVGGVPIGCGYRSRFAVDIFELFHRGCFVDDRPRFFFEAREGSSKTVNSRCISGGISTFKANSARKVGFIPSKNFFALEDLEFSFRFSDEFGVETLYLCSDIRLCHLASPLNRGEHEKIWLRKVREYKAFFDDRRMVDCAKCFDFIILSIGLLLAAMWTSLRSRSMGSLKGLLQGLSETKLRS